MAAVAAALLLGATAGAQSGAGSPAAGQGTSASSVAGRDGKSCMFYNVVSGPAESPFYYFTDDVQVNSGGSEPSGNRKGAKRRRPICRPPST
ncbi:hypothetical protein NicSoilB8_15340 [Arthrobacter sp. NicSoilB8]|nr:hypothetical protein NicSoilB8_15340 [Arthrobacter sp. NicSoilB8]